ncbi:unnamed protein product [Gordionus sp. m RMFG-2023]
MITFALNTEYYIDTDPKFLWSILADEDIDSNSTYGIPSDSADIDIYNINSYINTTDDTVTSLRFVQPNKGPLQVYEIHGSYIIYREMREATGWLTLNLISEKHCTLKNGMFSDMYYLTEFTI